MPRQDRHNFASNGAAYDQTNASNFAKLAPGEYMNGGVVVNPDGSILLKPKVYADDAVSFIAGCIKTNPTIDDEIKQHLLRFVDAMDARAVKRHGYSNAPDEAAFEWTQLSK